MDDKEFLSQECIEALYLANKTLKRLGEKGRLEDEGEDIIVTKGDNAVSRALSDYLKRNVPSAMIQSEEGKIIANPENPKFLIGFDEIDGTFNYSRGIFPYCTVITAFEYKENLKFEDVLFGGVLDNSDNLWHALKGKGCFLNHKRIYTSNRESLKDKDNSIPSVAIDLGPFCKSEDMQKYDEISGKSWIKNVSCAGVHLAGVASGGIDGFLCPVQKAHELGAGYRLIKEAGGELFDFEGNSIDEKIYEFDSKYKIIAAASKNLGKELSDLIIKF